MSTLRVSQVVRDTYSEGPGKRYAIWVQGCRRRCPGCCNPEMQPEDGGEFVDPLNLAADIAQTALDNPDLEGITLVGGEPFQQALACAEIATRIRSLSWRHLSVMVFTGFTIEQLKAKASAEPSVRLLLLATDVLIDGIYDQAQPEPKRRWVGSANQRVHFLTDFYKPDDPRFTEGNTMEIRYKGGQIQINGWPKLEVE